MAGCVSLITSRPHPLILRNVDKTTTSNKLVWPSASDGLSVYICQFSSKWWAAEAVRCVACLMLRWLKIGREEACKPMGREKSRGRKCKNAMLLLLNSWFLVVVVVVGGGVMENSAYWSWQFLLTAASVTDLWDVLQEHQKWSDVWAPFSPGVCGAHANPPAWSHSPWYETSYIICERWPDNEPTHRNNTSHWSSQTPCEFFCRGKRLFI